MPGQVSSVHVSDLPTVPPPTTLRRPGVALTRYPSAHRASLRLRSLRVCASGSKTGSGLRHLPAGSPPRLGRIEFTSTSTGSSALRTGRSPPVALHLASRPRSYLRLRAGERLPGEDLHLSDLIHSRAHWHGVLTRADGAKRMRALVFPANPHGLKTRVTKIARFE